MIDSPLTSGLSMAVNQLKMQGTLALKIAFTDEPEQISNVLGNAIVM